MGIGTIFAEPLPGDKIGAIRVVRAPGRSRADGGDPRAPYVCCRWDLITRSRLEIRRVSR